MKPLPVDPDVSERKAMNLPAKAKKAGQNATLSRYTEDWTRIAAEGGFDKLVGRGHEVQTQVWRYSSRRLKNNPILVGDPRPW